MSAMPSVNLTPAMTMGKQFSPVSRRQVFDAAMASLKTIRWAVFWESAPFVRTVRCRTVAKMLSIGLGQIDGPEDAILDQDDNIYVGNRTGDIVRFLAPDFSRQEVFAHVGGRPLGMAFAKDGSLLVCIGGMGLYSIDRDRSIRKLTDETNRSWFSVIDDSRLRLADDLDIAPDGRVFFSEATVRYEMHEWTVDCLESRGNGRIIETLWDFGVAKHPMITSMR